MIANKNVKNYSSLNLNKKKIIIYHLCTQYLSIFKTNSNHAFK